MEMSLGVLVSANFITLAVLFLLYFCYLHLQDYIFCLIYGFLFSEALWPVKIKVQAALNQRGLKCGDFLLSMMLLGGLGFCLLFILIFLMLFAFVDVLDMVHDLQLSIRQSTHASVPTDWVNGSTAWLQNQVTQLERHSHTAWFPLVNDTVAYINTMSEEGKSLSH